MERDEIVRNWINAQSISTHTLTWSVTILQILTLRTLRFQLTRSRGAWLATGTNYQEASAFQLTRSRGAWLNDGGYTTFTPEFQLTRSRGAWLVSLMKLSDLSNFNSHAHVERDTMTLWSWRATQISTHTLTWSVTPFHYNHSFFHTISTHTLTWSVTFHLMQTWKCTYISTHTLTWSVTRVSTNLSYSYLYFNSHAHVERDR